MKIIFNVYGKLNGKSWKYRVEGSTIQRVKSRLFAHVQASILKDARFEVTVRYQSSKVRDTFGDMIPCENIFECKGIEELNKVLSLFASKDAERFHKQYWSL